MASVEDAHRTSVDDYKCLPVEPVDVGVVGLGWGLLPWVELERRFLRGGRVETSEEHGHTDEGGGKDDLCGHGRIIDI